MRAAKDQNMITMEARVEDQVAAQVLIQLLDFHGKMYRRLFRDFYVLSKDVNALKRQYCEVITARHFNSLLYSVKTLISSLEEKKKEVIATKERKIRSAEVWLKEKLRSLKDLNASVKALATYQAAKKAAIKAGKRLRIPTKLRRVSLAQITRERARLRASIHHKRRYVAAAKGRLARLQGKSTLSVCFGSKALFRKQFNLAENGYQSHAAWAEDFAFARSTSAMFIGSKDESAGNQTAQYDVAAKTLQLRLPKTDEFAGLPANRLVISDITFPDRYLPHLQAAQRPPGPDAKKTDKVTSPVQVRIVKRKKCGGTKTALYVQLTCQPKKAPITTSRHLGAIGLDLNADHIAICEVDHFGNFHRAESLPFALNGLSSDQAQAVLGDYVAACVGMAKAAGKPIIIEKLDFSTKKATLREQGPGYARMLSLFAYAKFHELVCSRGSAEGVEVLVVNPVYSSVIGAMKFFGLDISTHEKAAMALARRALGFSERTKVFHGTRRPPVRMASAVATSSRGNSRRAKPRRRERHVWSLWARSAKAIRQGLVRGVKRRPRASVDFGESYNRHPLVAKAAGVMSLADSRGRRDHPSTEAQGSGNAARPVTGQTSYGGDAGQVCTG